MCISRCDDAVIVQYHYALNFLDFDTLILVFRDTVKFRVGDAVILRYDQTLAHYDGLITEYSDTPRL